MWTASELAASLPAPAIRYYIDLARRNVFHATILVAVGLALLAVALIYWPALIELVAAHNAEAPSNLESVASRVAIGGFGGILAAASLRLFTVSVIDLGVVRKALKLSLQQDD